MVISPVAATDPGLRQLLAEQQAELASAPGGAVPVGGVEYVAAYLDGHPVGCGGLCLVEPGVGEVRGMYVRPLYRGRGWSRLILAAIEEYAVENGYHTLRLEIGRALRVALALYASAGYSQVGCPADADALCFEKALAGTPAGL